MEFHERERGAAALLALCAMAAVLWLAVSLVAIVDYGAKGSDEYLEENRLRLAAEGQVESLAKELEKNPDTVDDYTREDWQKHGQVKEKNGIRVTAYLMRAASKGGGEDIFLRAWAEPEKAENRKRGKIVCGWLHREEDNCVWRGWKPLEDPAK